MDKVILISISKDELSQLIKNAVKDGVPVDENKSPESKLLKILELCEILKVSKATIHKWKKEGRIPFRRVSNRVFFDLHDVLASLDRYDPKKKGGWS